MPDSTRIEQYSAAINRLCHWIERHRQSDASWSRPSSSAGYFSLAPLANQIGRRDWSHAALALVQNTMVDGGVLRQASARDSYIAYVPCWFIWGAAEAGCVRLGNRLIDFVLGLQCRDTGGLFGFIADRDQQRGALSFDATAMGAIAFARAGRVVACSRVGDFFVRMLHEQPQPDRVFHTDVRQPGDLAIDDPAPNSALWWDQPKQHYYKMGLFVVALIETYAVTGTEQYLETAVKAYDLATDRAVDLWTNTLSHKMCWAAARLHAATDDRRYAEDACRYADHFLTLQQEDGAFHYPELWPEYPPEAWESLPNMGCQLGLWLALTRDALRASGGE